MEESFRSEKENYLINKELNLCLSLTNFLTPIIFSLLFYFLARFSFPRFYIFFQVFLLSLIS